MNSIFDKYVLPLLGFTVAVFVVFGLIAPSCRACAERKEAEKQAANRQYSSAEFFARRSDILANIAEYKDLFKDSGYTLMEDENTGYITYRVLESETEIMDNVTDPSGNVYSAVMAADRYGRSIGENNLKLMIYSSSLYLVIADEEDGTHSALFTNEDFKIVTSASDVSASDVSGSDAAMRADVLEAVPSARWKAMLEEYKYSLSPLLHEAEKREKK